MRHQKYTSAETAFTARYKEFIEFYRELSSMSRGIRDPTLIPKERSKVFHFGKKRGLSEARMRELVQEIAREIP